MDTSDRSLLFENTGAHKNSLKELGKYNKITQKYLKLFVLITILFIILMRLTLFNEQLDSF